MEYLGGVIGTTPFLQNVVEKVKIWSEEVKKLSFITESEPHALMQPLFMEFQLGELISLMLLISNVSRLVCRVLPPWRILFGQNLFQL